MEIWKEIKGYDGVYEVSNLGQVRSFKKGKTTILKQFKNGNGYLSVCFYFNSKPKTERVHVLVAEAFLNHERDGTTKLSVDHINGIKTDNIVSNLQVISHRENISKAVISKSGLTGVKAHNDKFLAYITINNKYIHLGIFDTAEIAHQNYLKKKLSLSN